jgi:hypothetical protein
MFFKDDIVRIKGKDEWGHPPWDKYSELQLSFSCGKMAKVLKTTGAFVVMELLESGEIRACTEEFLEKIEEKPIVAG